MGKKALSIVFGVMAVVAAGCGGGTKSQDAALSCEPAEAPVGASVVCSTQDIAEDCTLFLGNSPVAFTSDADAGTVSFVVPPTLPGEKDINVQCGAEDSRPVGKFSVPVPADTGTTISSDDDATVLPSGNPPSEGEGEEPGVSAISSKIGMAKPAGMTAAILQDRLLIKSMRDTESTARFSTYKITFQVPGNPKALYLSGNLFNRKASDAGLDDSDPCGKLGSGADARYLATQADGSKLNEGSALYDQYAAYVIGEVCGEGEDCRHDQETDERNPWCKISPKNAAGDIVTTGEFYTRSLVERGTVCLAVQDQDDAWTVDCDVVVAPKVVVTETSVDVDQDRPVVSMRFDYANAEKEPAVLGSGCHKTGGSTPDHLGNGTYEAECPIGSDKQAFGVYFNGIGERNNAGRFYALELGAPSATFKIGAEPAYNTAGPMSLFYKVSRPYTLKGKDVLFGDANYSTFKAGQCPWAKGVELRGRYVVDGAQVTDPAFRKIESGGDADTEVKGYKDYTSVSWRLVVRDFADHGWFSEAASSGFPFSFNIVSFNGSWNYNYQYDNCDGAFEGGKDECCNGSDCPHDSDNAGAYACHDYRVRLDLGWAGQNVSEVKMTCTPMGESKDAAFTKAFTADQTVWSSDRIGGEKVACHFLITSKMGTTLEAAQVYERGHGVCDGNDRGGNDHNDAGFDD